jgi:hypothetical protein
MNNDSDVTDDSGLGSTTRPDTSYNTEKTPSSSSSSPNLDATMRADHITAYTNAHDDDVDDAAVVTPKVSSVDDDGGWRVASSSQHSDENAQLDRDAAGDTIPTTVNASPDVGFQLQQSSPSINNAAPSQDDYSSDAAAAAAVAAATATVADDDDDDDDDVPWNMRAAVASSQLGSGGGGGGGNTNTHADDKGGDRPNRRVKALSSKSRLLQPVGERFSSVLAQRLAEERAAHANRARNNGMNNNNGGGNRGELLFNHLFSLLSIIITFTCLPFATIEHSLVIPFHSIPFFRFFTLFRR